MIPKTFFSPEALKDILLSYDLGDYRESSLFEGGSDQTNMKLVTSSGNFAFRCYEKRTDEYIEYEIELLNYLIKHHYLCPEPLKNGSDEYVTKYNSKPCTIFTFLKGRLSESNENFILVTKAISELHKITINLNPKNSEFRVPHTVDYCWERATENLSSNYPSSKAQAKLSWLRVELDELQIPVDMPEGAIHGDINRTNFLYLNGNISAVLDFDQSSYTYLLYDIANILYWWAWPNKGSLDFDKAKAILSEYQKSRMLTREEKLHLFDVLKLAILIPMSWFIRDESDFENGKRKIKLLNNVGRNDFVSCIFS